MKMYKNKKNDQKMMMNLEQVNLKNTRTYDL